MQADLPSPRACFPSEHGAGHPPSPTWDWLQPPHSDRGGWEHISNTELQDMEQERVLMYSFDEITCDIYKLRNNGHIDFVNSIFRPCLKMTCMPIGK